MTEPLPCPRCHNAYIARLEGEFVAVCDCNPWGRTREEAKALWNRRLESWMKTNEAVRQCIEREFKEYPWEGTV